MDIAVQYCHGLHRSFQPSLDRRNIANFFEKSETTWLRNRLPIFAFAAVRRSVAREGVPTP